MEKETKDPSLSPSYNPEETYMDERMGDFEPAKVAREVVVEEEPPLPTHHGGKGRPEAGYIHKELEGVSPEDQMRKDIEIRKVAPKDGFKPFTHHTIHEISRMNNKKREEALKGLGQIEWNRCSKDIFYCLDSARHVFPYVKTIVP